MATPAIDRPVLLTRALLADDMDAFRRLNAGLDHDEIRAFTALFAAAFHQAANDKFGSDYTVADVIEFVVEARARHVGTVTVSAEDAECVIRAVLGEEDLANGMTPYARSAAQTAMLIALVHDARFSAGEIDVLLDVAAQRARSFFERQGRR